MWIIEKSSDSPISPSESKRKSEAESVFEVNEAVAAFWSESDDDIGGDGFTGVDFDAGIAATVVVCIVVDVSVGVGVDVDGIGDVEVGGIIEGTIGGEVVAVVVIIGAVITGAVTVGADMRLACIDETVDTFVVEIEGAD